MQQQKIEKLERRKKERATALRNPILR